MKSFKPYTATICVEAEETSTMNNRKTGKSSLRTIGCCAAILGLLSVGWPSVASAQPAWRDVNGVWWNNMCRAPSGAWWLYPVAAAQPVGSACTIYSTGEPGVVTMK